MQQPQVTLKDALTTALERVQWAQAQMEAAQGRRRSVQLKLHGRNSDDAKVDLKPALERHTEAKDGITTAKDVLSAFDNHEERIEDARAAATKVFQLRGEEAYLRNVNTFARRVNDCLLGKSRLSYETEDGWVHKSFPRIDENPATVFEHALDTALDVPIYDHDRTPIEYQRLHRMRHAVGPDAPDGIEAAQADSHFFDEGPLEVADVVERVVDAIRRSESRRTKRGRRTALETGVTSALQNLQSEVSEALVDVTRRIEAASETFAAHEAFVAAGMAVATAEAKLTERRQEAQQHVQAWADALGRPTPELDTPEALVDAVTECYRVANGRYWNRATAEYEQLLTRLGDLSVPVLSTPVQANQAAIGVSTRGATPRGGLTSRALTTGARRSVASPTRRSNSGGLDGGSSEGTGAEL